MDDDAGWVRVVVRVAPESAELAADRLWAFAPAAIEEQTTPDGTRLLAGFAGRAVAAEALAAVEADGLGRGELVPVDDPGLDGWRRWARVEHAPPFVIVPTWLEAPAVVAGTHLLAVDPGHTFGSGSHPTTRLVLAGLAERVRPGHRVLDVGCGSGILSVAAALLGAAAVTGIDIDDASPAACAANAARNGVADRVSASTTSLPDLLAGGAAFDVVAANLLAPVVVELAPSLAAAVAPGGSLLVSGLLADRWAATTDHLDGLTVADVATADGWAAITLRRPD